MLEILKIHPGFSASASFKHNTLIELVFRHLLNSDLLEELGQVKLTGYKFGSHPFLQYQNQFLTLDLLTSFLEYRSLNHHLKFSENSKPILEIGAGSGRFAEIFMNFNGANKYVIADIPPALFISFKRLQLIYPEKRIIYVSDKLSLNSYVESEEWDIIFILPWLLKHFPQKFFKIAIAIDCLHEMADKQRGFLINMAESKSENFYLKVWDETYLPLDNIKLDIRNQKHYFTKPHWKVVFSNSCVFPGDYKEICYEFSK